MAAHLVYGDLPRSPRRMRNPAAPNMGGSPYLVPGFFAALLADHAAAAARVSTPSLSRMWLTWCSTVFGLMKRRLPILAFDRPRPRSASTSSSRRVSSVVERGPLFLPTPSRRH